MGMTTLYFLRKFIFFLLATYYTFKYLNMQLK